MFNAAPSDIGQWLVYGMYLLMGALCLACIGRALWAPIELVRRACCGGCGHAVSAGSIERCPECGGAYAKVGISTPSMAMRLRGSLMLALLAWTILVVVIGSYSRGWLQSRARAASSAAAALAARTARQTERFGGDLTPTPVGTGVSSGGAGTVGEEDREAVDYRIAVAMDTVTVGGLAASGRGGTIESGTCVFRLRRTAGSETVELSVQLPDGEFVLKDDQDKTIAEGKKDDKVDIGVIEKWFKAAGANTENKAVQRGMKDALRAVNLARFDPMSIETLRQPPMPLERGSLVMRRTNRSRGAAGATGVQVGPPRPSLVDYGIWGGGLVGLWVVGGAAIAWRNRRVTRGQGADASSVTSAS